jgi:hypothetical protein
MNKKYMETNWSQLYYPEASLTEEQHEANNEWFASQMEGTTKGVCVPELGLCWDKNMTETKIEKYDFVYADMVSHKAWFLNEMGGE